jgi:hypothetical protein
MRFISAAATYLSWTISTRDPSRDAMSDILDRLTVADMLALDAGRKSALMYHI